MGKWETRMKKAKAIQLLLPVLCMAWKTEGNEKKKENINNK